MFRLLHISITPVYQPINRQVIQGRLNDLGRDWLCYNAFSFVLWTNKSPVTVSEMLAGHLHQDDQLMVFLFGTQEMPTGRMPNWVWDWINRPRNPSTGDVLTPALPAPAATNLFEPGSWLLPPASQ